MMQRIREIFQAADHVKSPRVGYQGGAAVRFKSASTVVTTKRERLKGMSATAEIHLELMLLRDFGSDKVVGVCQNVLAWRARHAAPSRWAKGLPSPHKTRCGCVAQFRSLSILRAGETPQGLQPRVSVPDAKGTVSAVWDLHPQRSKAVNEAAVSIRRAYNGDNFRQGYAFPRLQGMRKQFCPPPPAAFCCRRQPVGSGPMSLLRIRQRWCRTGAPPHTSAALPQAMQGCGHTSIVIPACRTVGSGGSFGDSCKLEAF